MHDEPATQPWAPITRASIAIVSTPVILESITDALISMVTLERSLVLSLTPDGIMLQEIKLRGVTSIL